ncbi:MAG: restriction endonuclease [Sphingobium sp.]|nr:MAG: restriction endonuclease [Sphingobium sp.]
MSKFGKSRNRCVLKQGGYCYYCQQPMWSADPDTFASRYGISVNQARLLQATAEHLIAQCDGGDNDDTNIVAACKFCNTKRHHARPARSPSAHSRRVRARLASGKWHGLRLHSVDTRAPSI